MPAVSIIVPAYNASGTIAAALSSIEKQDYRDFEVIVVDDTSGDDTVTVAGQWIQSLTDASAPNRYCVVERASNGGPAVARNDGIGRAKGEWLAFLDGDDTWLPHRLSTQMAAAAVCADAAMWCGRVVSDGGVLSDGPQTRNLERPTAGVPPRRVPLAEFAEHNPVATSTVLVRKTAVDAAGGFDAQFRGPEDIDLWLRIAQRYAIMWMDVPLAHYRSVPGSLSMDERKFLPQVLAVFDKAFAPGGALASLPGLRRVAVSTQLWNASWMAFSRGARLKAVTYWWRAYCLQGGTGRTRRPWWRLLARYAVGRKPCEAGQIC